MTLKYTLENLDSVEDDEIKALYRQDGDAFQLDLDAYAEYVKAPVVAKNRNYQKRLEKVKPFADKFGSVTADDWQAYQDWKNSQGDDDPDDPKPDDKPDAKKIAKQVKAELKKEFDAQLATKDKELADERAKFESYRFNRELTAAALDAGVIGSRLRKFITAAIEEGQFSWQDGKMVVLDDDGEPVSESVKERFKKLSADEDWMFFFEMKEPGGGGGKGEKGRSQNNAKTIPRSQWDKLTQSQRDAKISAGVTPVDD